MYDPDAVKFIVENLESSEIVGKHKSNLLFVSQKTTKTLILPSIHTVFNVLLNKMDRGEGDSKLLLNLQPDSQGGLIVLLILGCVFGKFGEEFLYLII